MQKSSADPSGVTVIICCYNSAGRIAETLRHLAQQELQADLRFEVLLVNNASTDDTVATAQKTWEELSPGISLRIVNEQVPGQNHARRKGIEEAAFEIIIFCDDDNWLNKNYVQTAYQTMRSDEKIGAAGGQNIPATDALSYPDWFDEYSDKYALGIPALASGDITQRGFVLGAGMVTRRSLFLEMYDDKYPTLLKGRDGESLSTGDDFEYCKRLLLRGYSLFYAQPMTLQHFIPKERLTLSYRERLMAGIYDAGKVINKYDDAIKIFRRNRHKNRLRIFLLTPLRILLSKLGLSGRRLEDERLALYYASPFEGNDPVKAAIKRFIYGS
ncbi:MAG: hypothetical protein DI535_19625 [Citrobacter freundii]|nr:MAG: hypothetical protein DI535_19625 [Citrobacter freundii]